MELAEVLETRRSIRAYQPDKKVTREQVEEMIKAAILAPSWKNSQTARYFVVMSDDKMKEIRESCLPEYNQNNCKDASAIIITTFVKNRAGFNREGQPDNELGNEWGAYDLGLQNENLLLKATEMGIGSLVMGLRDAKTLSEKLDIPDDQEVVSVISLGYPNIEPDMPKRKSVEDIAIFF